MKNYNFFEETLKYHIVNTIHNPHLIQTTGTDGDQRDFAKSLYYNFNNAKCFEIDDDLKELLVNTEGTKDVQNLPFDKMFLDVEFDLRSMKEKQIGRPMNTCKGLLISKRPLGIRDMVGRDATETEKEVLNSGFGIIIYALCLDDTGFSFNTIKVVNTDFQEYKIKVESPNPKLRKFVLNFVGNVINLINNPEREIIMVDKEYSPAKNKRRIRQGKSEIKPSIRLVPTQDLRVYINQLRTKQKHLSHSFWVRGHWRVYRNETRYKDNVGKRIWIRPFIKGKGVLIDKVYDVKTEEVRTK